MAWAYSQGRFILYFQKQKIKKWIILYKINQRWYDSRNEDYL